MKRLLTILFIPALLLFGGPSEGYAFDELSLKKLRAMNHCANCDLSGANLSGANLKEAILWVTILSLEDPPNYRRLIKPPDGAVQKDGK